MRIDDVIDLVNVALGNATSNCPGGIPADADVDVGFIIQAVNNALDGCPGDVEGGRLAAASSGCGGLDDACCAGETCNGSQHVCAGAGEAGSGVCVRCGGTPHSHEGELCCADGSCNPGFTCIEGICSGGCGQLDETCCGSSDHRSCNTANLACDLEGFCAICGVSGGPCCESDSCHPGLTCYSAFRAGNNTCQCGGPDTTCCAGSSCAPGTVCESGTCRSVACGGLDQPCCSGIVQCGADLFCSNGVCTIPLG